MSLYPNVLNNVMLNSSTTKTKLSSDVAQEGGLRGSCVRVWEGYTTRNSMASLEDAERRLFAGWRVSHYRGRCAFWALALSDRFVWSP